MRYSFFFALTGVFFVLQIQAQQNGILFSGLKDWRSVLAEAKIQNKAIFVDCYTTWCLPCKIMDQEVFTQQEVGKYMNDRFICVRIQMDKTEADSSFIRNWYNDASNIAQVHEVNNYPTFLFLDASGKLLHRAAGLFDPADLIRVASYTFDSTRRWSVLKQLHPQENYQPDSYLTLAVAQADFANEELATKFLQKYLQNNPDSMNADLARLLLKLTRKTTDPGFSVILNRAEEVDAWRGAGAAEGLIKQIVLQEWKDFQKEQPEEERLRLWESFVKKRYPIYASEILTKHRVSLYKLNEDWEAFVKTVNSMLNDSSIKIASVELTMYASELLATKDSSLLREGIRWTEHFDNQESENLSQRLITRAVLFYKLGENEKALETARKAIQQASEAEKENLNYFLRAMEAGEKLW